MHIGKIGRSIQNECHSLTLSQINLIVGTVADIVRKLCIVNFTIAVNENYTDNFSIRICITQGSGFNQLVTQLNIAGPAFAVSLVDILNGGVYLTVCVRIVVRSTAVGRIIDADSIQDEIISLGCIGGLLIKCRLVNSLNENLIPSVSQILDLHDRNLPDMFVRLGIQNPQFFHCRNLSTCCRIFRELSCLCSCIFLCNLIADSLYPFTVCVGISHVIQAMIVAIIRIDNLILDLCSKCTVLCNLIHLNHNGARSCIGHADDIEAGTRKGKACLCSIIIIDSCPHGRTQRIGGHFLIRRVIAVDVVGIGQRISAGTVLLLNSVCRRAHRRPDRSCRILNNCPIAFPGLAALLLLPGQIVILKEAILVVDGSCGDNGDGVVVVAVLVSVCIYAGVFVIDRIGELLVGLHLHTVAGIGRIANLTGVGINLCAAISAVVGVAESGQHGFTCSGVFQTIRVCTNTCQLAVFTKHVICQNGDIHGHTVVNDHRVGVSTYAPYNSKPDNRMGVVVAHGIVCQSIGVSRSIIRLVLGDISACHFSVTLRDLPCTGGIGVDRNPVCSAFIIQFVITRQHIPGSCCNIKKGNIFDVVQQDRLVFNRIGNGNLVCKGASLAGCLVDNDVAVFVYQVEGKGNVGFLPCHGGGNSVLIAGVTQIVVVIQRRELVCGIGACFFGSIHSTFQVDIIPHCQLRGLDSAQLPVEGLRRQHIGIASGSTVCIHAGGDGYAIHFNTVNIGIVQESLGVDDTLEIVFLRAVRQDIVTRIVGINNFIIYGTFRPTLDSVTVCIDLVRVSLAAICAESYGFQNGIGTLTVADLIRSDGAVQVVLTGVNIVGDDLDLGFQGLAGSSIAINHRVGGGLHLQTVATTHLVNKSCVAGCVGDLGANCTESIVQFGCCGNLVVVLRTAGLVGGQGCNGLIHAGLGDVGVSLCIEGDGKHSCAQTGNHIHIGFTGRRTQSIGLADDLIGLVGIALDGVCHTMLVEHAVAIVVNFIVVVCVSRAVQIQLIFSPCTGDPVVPKGGSALSVVIVPLHGRTVRHENHEQVAIFGFNGSTQLVDGIECVVIVGTGSIIQRVAACQIFNGDECAFVQSAGTGINLGFGVCGIGNLVRHHVIGITVVGCAAFTVVIAIEAVKVRNGNTDIQQLTVIAGSLEPADQALQRLFQNLRTGLIGAGNCIAGHGGRGIQHDDNIDTALHGNTGSGDFHLGDTGGLEVDAGGGLVDLKGALVGVLRIVVDNARLNPNFHSTQNLVPVGDLHPVRAVRIAVEGVLPCPGQLGVCQFGLVGAVGIGGSVAGDAGLHSGHSPCRGGTLRHGVDRGTFEQRIDGAAGCAAGGTGVLVETNTLRMIGCIRNRPGGAIVDNTPLCTINIADSVEAAAHVLDSKLNAGALSIADTVGFLIQVLGAITLGDEMICRCVVISVAVQNMILIITSIRSCGIAADRNGVGSTIAGTLRIQDDRFVVVHDDVLVS